MFKKLYEKSVLAYPGYTLACIAIITVFFAAFIPQFRLDASSESLLLEGDQALKYYREMQERYGSDDFLIITYTPQNDLFHYDSLQDLGILRDKLKKLNIFSSVTTILDVPLINSPPVTIEEFKQGIQTLTAPKTDINLARKELTSSPLYKKLLISEDAKTTAILAVFKPDKIWNKLLKERNNLRNKDKTSDLSEQEEKKLKNIEQTFIERSIYTQKQQDKNIQAIRNITKEHTNSTKIHIGGATMITVDSLEFVRQDLKTFGVAILCFIILLLTIFFRKIQWVILPMLTCGIVGIIMFGFLGFVGWPVTVVSSNFISLLLIFTLSFSVHQIVRYNEYCTKHPKENQRNIVTQSTLKIIKPCLFMVVTTIVAFGSLIVSDIRPVIDFGLMMAIGLAISFLIAFSLFPSILMFLAPVKTKKHYDITGKITSSFAFFVQRHGKLILFAFSITIVLCVIGIKKLTVENSFIEYYKEETEIYQGMKLIDEKLGGTMPLDVIIDAPDDFLTQYKEKKKQFRQEHKTPYTPHIIDGYWIIQPRDNMRQIHKYLDELSETGKVLSFDTTMQMAHDIDPSAVNTIILATLKDNLQ